MNIIREMIENKKIFFAPQLCIPNGIRDVEFYIKGLGAIELRRWSNDDGTIHVSELSIEGNLFHLHQENVEAGLFAPGQIAGVTATIGLFVPDVDGFINRALLVGAILVSAAKDYDYGYRQGEIKDPFGHRWLIEKKI